jgi:hypothetical protein
MANQSLSKLMSRLGSPRLSVVLLAILAVLTFGGTLYQVDHGLHAAVQKYFGSWFVMLWEVIPFPGTKLVFVLLALNLLGSALGRFKYRWHQMGLLMTHCGFALLLLSAAVAHYAVEETFVSFGEGESTDESISYDAWEVVVWPMEAVDNIAMKKLSRTVSVDATRQGQVLYINEYGLKIALDTFYPHVQIRRPAVSEGDTLLLDALQRMEQIVPAKRLGDPGRETPAVVLRVGQEGGAAFSQQLQLHGAMEYPQRVESRGRPLFIALRRKHSPMPLALTLLDFKKENYLGTSMARSYTSSVRVQPQAAVAHEVTISMNKPFRYKDYTFYQSSYTMSEQGERSTLAVVRNPAQSLPALSTIFMAIGMALHFLLKLVRHQQQVRKTHA